MLPVRAAQEFGENFTFSDSMIAPRPVIPYRTHGPNGARGVNNLRDMEFSGGRHGLRRKPNILPVPKKNPRAYMRMARIAEKVWRKLGAIGYKECFGDDFKTKWETPFSKMMKLKPGETVVFSYIVFKSRVHRDRVNAKVMEEVEKMCGPKDMPFDVKRMVDI
jgi:uncharacterized protein YbaA (DUF1428 family)